MSPVKGKKKEILTKKAPGAPKRFKSSYILFFMHVQDQIKKDLPPGTHTVSLSRCAILDIEAWDLHLIISILSFLQAPVVSKKASELWRKLSAHERIHWDVEAAKEKKRYLAEKELYTGPVSREMACGNYWLGTHTS